MKRVFHISRRVLKFIFFTILVLVVGIAIFLNSNYFDSFLKKQLETRVAKAIDRKVTVDSVAFNPFMFDFLLKNFTVGNDPRTPEVPFFRADEIYARISWKNLFARRFRISKVRLLKPELYLSFYDGGGNNWPKTKKKEKKKGGGLDLIVENVDVDDMTVVYDNHRVPLRFFTAKNLETVVRYDRKQGNYVATTNFKEGFLKIKDYEFFKFELRSDYRIIGSRVAFERLLFLSTRSKFYMAGEMYNFKDPFFDFRFRSHIDLDQAKEMFHLGTDMTGHGVYKANWKGTFGNFRMIGNGEFKNFRFYSLPINRARFDLEMTDNSLDVTNIRAEMFQGSYKGTFAIAPLKGHSIFKTTGNWKDWDGLALGRLIKMENMLIPVKMSGTASLIWDEGNFKGVKGPVVVEMEPFSGMKHDLALTAENTDFNNTLFEYQYVLPARTRTEFDFGGRKLRNLKSHIELPYTRADIEGTIDFSGEADLHIRSSSQKIAEIDLLFKHLQSYFGNEPAASKEFWRVEGAADFEGKMDGTVWSPFQPRITGTVDAKNVLYHGVLMDSVRADVMFYKKIIEIYDSQIFVDDSVSQARATFFLEDNKRGTPDALEVKAVVKNFPAHDIAHAFTLELPVTGKVNAELELHGPFSAVEGRADFTTTAGELYGERWDSSSGTVLFFSDSLGLRDITIQVGGGYAKASGDLVYENDSYNVTYSVVDFPVERLQLLKQKGYDIQGKADVEGSGEGTLQRPNLTADLKIKNLVYRKEPYGDITSKINLYPGRLILQASGVARGVPSDLTANLRLDGDFPFEANFDIRKFPLELFTRVYSPQSKNIAGLIGGKFTMSGRLRPAARVDTLDGALDLVELDLGGLKLRQEGPVPIALDEAAVVIKESIFSGDNMRIGLSGEIYPKENNRLNLTLNADVGLEILSSWDKNITASGLSTTKVAITGTVNQPALTGVMDIRKGFFRHYSFPNSLTDINALVTFKNRNITLQSFNAESSGGTLTAGGSATLKGYSLDTYRFDVYAQKIRVHFPEGLRSTVNAELHLQTDKAESYLVGDVEVLQGVYVRSFEESPDIFNYARVPTFAGIAGAPAASARKDVNLNIKIHSDRNLMVRNNFANIESSADLQVIGSFDNPVLIGRMDVQRGTINFRDRNYKVVRGSLDFSNPYRTEALLNFQAETRIREYTINLNFQGTFDRVYHELSSDPPLPKDDIYALLGIGRTPEELQGVADVPTLIAGQEISAFIANPITSPLEKGFKKIFGLERFQIDPTYVQSTEVATARVTVQKDISRDFSITYSTNVFTAAEEIILLQYQVSDDIQLTASKDERARYGIDVLVTKTFE